jgi:hypothetical protein
MEGSCDEVLAGALASLCRPRRKVAAGDNSHMGTRATIRQCKTVPAVRLSCLGVGVLYDFAHSLPACRSRQVLDHTPGTKR